MNATIPNALTTIESPFMVTYRDAGAGNPIQCYLNGISQTVTQRWACVTDGNGDGGVIRRQPG